MATNKYGMFVDKFYRSKSAAQSALQRKKKGYPSALAKLRKLGLSYPAYRWKVKQLKAGPHAGRWAVLQKATIKKR